MSEEIEHQEEEVVETTETEQAAESSAEAEPQEMSSEERARLHGWVPKDEFRGDPERWTDAETFLKRGEEITPILKENNRRLEQRMHEMQSSVQELREFYKKSEERAYQQALKDLQEREERAFEDGDKEAFRAAQAERAKLAKEAPKAEPQQPQIDPAITEWKAKNEWFDRDPVAAQAAIALDAKLASDNPHWSVSQVLSEVSRQMQRRFPEHFENQRRSSPPSVEGASRPQAKKRGKTYGDLPPEAKQQCDKFVRTIPGFTKEEYVKNFSWDK